MKWSRIIYNICDPDSSDSALFIRKGIRRTRESYPLGDFFAQILLFKVNACVHAFCSRPRLISIDTIMHREKKARYRNLFLHRFWLALLSYLPQLRYSSTVQDIRHYVIYTLFPEYPRYHSGATKRKKTRVEIIRKFHFTVLVKLSDIFDH